MKASVVVPLTFLAVIFLMAIGRIVANLIRKDK